MLKQHQNHKLMIYCPTSLICLIYHVVLKFILQSSTRLIKLSGYNSPAVVVTAGVVTACVVTSGSFGSFGSFGSSGFLKTS